MLRNVLVARSKCADAPVVPRRRSRPLVRIVLAAAAATAIAFECSGATAAPAAVRAGAASQVCAKIGVTKPVLTKVFGAGAHASIYKATTSTYCDITPPGVSLQACETAECTDVFIFTTALSAEVASEAAQLKQYGKGHVSEVPVAGAGGGAVLVKDTNYGPAGYGLGRVLFFPGGADTIATQGSLGGPPVFKQWEALARAVHAHMG